MEEIPARAALVPATNVAEGLTTSVARDDVKKAIQSSDGPLELILDLTRFQEGDAAETRSIAVAWERKDLEELLSKSQGEQVVLTFDGKALREAFESDVEAHGLRERALVLAVAATAATGIAAGAASGNTLGENDRAHFSSAAVTQTSLGADDRDVSRADPLSQPSLHSDDRDVSRADPLSQPSLHSDDRAVPRTDPLAQPPSLHSDDRAVPRAAPEPVTGLPGPHPDDRALPRTDPLAQPPSLSPDDRALPRTDPLAQPPSLSPDDRALPRTFPVSQPALGPDDRPLPRTDPLAQPEPVTGTSDDGTFIEAPSPGTIAVIGGIALAITGAAFAAAAASRRRVHPA
jgi:hypothetical protein